MGLQLKNKSTSLLAGTITDSATTLSVTAATGARFPSLSGSDWFALVVVDSAGGYEIMRATGRASDVITVTRGQEGTSARAFDAGARVELRITAAAIADILTDIDAALTAAINAALAVPVDTADLADEAVTSAKIADDAVVTAKIDDDAVTTPKIPDSAITTAKVAATAITTAKIALLNITTALLAAASVTYAKIQDVAAHKVLGNSTGSAAAPAELGLGPNLTDTGGNLDTKYGPKAWVKFTVSATVPTVVDSFNVASVTQTGAAIFTITFTAPMADANYVVMGMASVRGVWASVSGTPGTSSFAVGFDNSAGGLYPTAAYIAVFGN